MKSTDKQPTERGPLVNTTGKEFPCFVCRKPITEGQPYYKITKGACVRSRHRDCARNIVETREAGGRAGKAKNGRVIKDTKTS